MVKRTSGDGSPEDQKENKTTDYEKIILSIKNAPTTYLIGILANVAMLVKTKRMFKKGRLQNFIKKIDNQGLKQHIRGACVSEHLDWINKGFNFCPICGEYLR